MSDNLRHWNALFRTNPEFTRNFQAPGGFRGTATNPTFTYLQLTEHFGPCGQGWGFNQPDFKIVPGGSTEQTLVYCIVECWYMDDDSEKCSVWGVGGDRPVKQDNRGISVDDDSFKKALTDAIGNAFSRLGSGADIRLGLWNDVKYLAETKEAFRTGTTVPGLTDRTK